MLSNLTLLLLCQLAGEVLARLLGLPLPGPVVGMALLFGGLVARRRMPVGLEETAHGLLRHLALLFVPAGVGVTLYLPLIADEWLPISFSLLASTAATIAVTAAVMRALAPRRNSDR